MIAAKDDREVIKLDSEYMDSSDTNTDWHASSRKAVRLMQQRNEAWLEEFALGDRPYAWNIDKATLRFERDADHVVATICLVGTASECEGTFLWSWANDTIPSVASRDLSAVREFGEAHDLTLLTTPEFKGGRAEGLEMLAVAGRILDAEGVFVDRAGDVTLFFAILGFQLE